MCGRNYLHLPTLLIILGLVVACSRTPLPLCSEFFAEGDLDRFEDLGAGRVLDRDAGLEWYRCSVGQNYRGRQCTGDPYMLKWSEAKSMIGEISEKSGTTWRLPTISEMSTLTEKQCRRPSLNPTAFPGILIENYWASDESPYRGYRCGVYTFNAGKSCRLFDSLELPFLMVRSGEK